MKGFGAEASAPVGDGGAFEVWADGGAWPGRRPVRRPRGRAGHEAHGPREAPFLYKKIIVLISFTRPKSLLQQRFPDIKDGFLGILVIK